MAKTFSHRFTHWLSHIEAHHRLAISLGVAALSFLASQGDLAWRTQLIATWDAYALSMLATTWTRIYKAEPRVVVRLAKLNQLSRNLIFVFVMVAACASLAAVAFTLATAKAMTGAHFATHIALAIGTVILSWLVLHTIFTLHYAHLFFSEHHGGKPARGLLFPNGDFDPDYLDFAYFAFVIGMTSQVSDVQISS